LNKLLLVQVLTDQSFHCAVMYNVETWVTLTRKISHETDSKLTINMQRLVYVIIRSPVNQRQGFKST